MSIKKYLPNKTSLMHYAGTNILTNIMVIVNAGFWMGFICSMILQVTVELNQFSMSGLNPKEYFKKKGIDTIWDTIFAIAGVFATLINAIVWI